MSKTHSEKFLFMQLLQKKSQEHNPKELEVI